MCKSITVDDVDGKGAVTIGYESAHLTLMYENKYKVITLLSLREEHTLIEALPCFYRA